MRHLLKAINLSYLFTGHSENAYSNLIIIYIDKRTRSMKPLPHTCYFNWVQYMPRYNVRIKKISISRWVQLFILAILKRYKTEQTNLTKSMLIQTKRSRSQIPSHKLILNIKLKFISSNANIYSSSNKHHLRFITAR